MHKSKLIQLLRSFDKNEWKAFMDFVNSPYHNKRKELIPLVAYLQEHRTQFDSDLITKAIVYKKLFPSTAYDDKKIRYLMSYVYNLGLQFLAQEQLKKETFLAHRLQLKNLMSRNCERPFQQIAKKASSIIEEHAFEDTSYFEMQYQLADLKDRHFRSSGQRAFDLNIQMASNQLDYFYLSKKLKYWCVMVNREKLLNHKYEWPFKPILLQWMQAPAVQQKNFLQLYFNLYSIQSSLNSRTNFDRLQEKILTEGDSLPYEDQQSVYLYMINYCAEQIRSGNADTKIVEVALALYLKGMQLNLFLFDGYLSHWTFKNVISLGLRLQRFEWVEKFILEMKNEVAPKYRKDVLNYNLAELYFYQKDYSKTLHHLNRLRYSDMYYHLNGRVKLLQTYFHLEEYEALFSLIASFSVYLRRNEAIAKDTKQSYLNFCASLNKIVKGIINHRSINMEAIKQLQPLAYKKWLLEISGGVKN